VLVTLNGTVVGYEVTDPARGLKAESVNTPGVVITPVPSGGVVAWVAGSTVYYRIYDPVRGAWKGGSASSAGFIPEVKNANGVVAWIAGNSVNYRVYDPARAAWIAGGDNFGVFIPDVFDEEGLVSWSAGNGVFYRTYDPTRGAWMGGNLVAPGSVSGLIIGDGVAAWTAGNAVYGRVYNLDRGVWSEANATGLSGFISNPAITNATITWTAGTTSFRAGYNPFSAVWSNMVTLPKAGFAASTNAGNAPLTNWFNDLSFAARNVVWNFGDGSNPSTARAPLHIFTNFARYTVTQTVSGPGGSDATNRTILGDVSPPTGSVLIDGGAAFTRSTNVTLALSATDNSGIVAGMRFSNSGTNWSATEAYATNKAWALASGDGLKTVFVQFLDGASNVSAAVTNTIRLDTQPLPTVAFATNNFVVGESVGTLTLSVSLSASTVFTAAVHYATSDGTATAGVDYTERSGQLIFLPGERTKTFSLSISNDTLVELNETIVLTLSDATNAILSDPALVTIIDDDTASMGFATNVFRADETLSQATISVQLSAASGRTVTVQYATANGTATAGADYIGVSNVLTFLPGQTMRTFTVPLMDDLMDEPEETVFLSLSQATNATLGALGSAMLIIIDDDAPTASFTANTFAGDEASGSAVISVRLSSVFNQTVFVDYETGNGTAQAGSDYIPTSGTLVFAPGVTNRTFFVTILPDSTNEPLETLTARLTGFVNTTPGPIVQATVLIVDPASQAILSDPMRQTNGAFQFTVLAPLGRIYSIEGSTNLASWSEVGRLTNSSFFVPFVDPTAANVSRRFYRAKQTP
jgi:PKD repeat protein